MSARNSSTYSHNGCTRCKKMKIKCDEKQPTCGACERKKVECIYEFPFVIYNPLSSKKKKNKAGSRVTKDSGNNFKIKPEDKRILQITLPSAFKFVAEKFDDESSSSSQTESPGNENSYASKKYDALSNPNLDAAFESLTTNDQLNNVALGYNLGSPSNLLSTDDLTHIKLEHDFHIDWTKNYNSVPEPGAQSFSIRDAVMNGPVVITPPEHLNPVTLPQLYFQYYITGNDPKINEYFTNLQIIIDQYNLTVENDQIKKVIWNFFICTKTLSNHLFVNDDYENNELIEWIQVLIKNAENENIIFTTIIATTANAIFLQTELHYWYVIRQKYMDLTLKLLSEYISQKDSFIVMTCLLFTVLLLYSERSATDSPVWRLHLKGALGILQRISKHWKLSDLYKLENRSKELNAAIKLFEFCQCWFLAAESLAWVSSVNGGSMPIDSLSDINDAREVMFQNLSYEKINPVNFGGFNTVRFYNSQLIEVMNEIVLHIMYLRVNYNFEFTDLDCVLFDKPPTEESRILGETLLKRIEETGNEFDFSSCSDSKLATTMRYGAICYSIGLRCYIMTAFLGYNIRRPEIHDLAKQFAENNAKMGYLQCSISVHWPSFYVACCTVDKELRQDVIKPMKHMVKMKMMAAKYSLDRVEQIWYALDNEDYSKLVKIDTICF